MEIKVLHQVMDWNEDVSEEVKETLSAHHICMINVMGSPGAGKTSLITSLIDRLRKDWRVGVIEGDIAGQVDAERIADLGIPAVQLNTDGACHIEAMSIQHILPELPLDDLDVIFVENIGNLVCPAEFRIGESLRITILSIPEGDDKVEKYPLMFTDTDCLVLNKYDMLPYFDFDEKRVRANYETVNPGAPSLQDQQSDRGRHAGTLGLHRGAHQESTVMKTVHIEVEGIVQGVGFRPFLHRLASRHHICGWVRNTSAGLEGILKGEPEELEHFIEGTGIFPAAYGTD